MQISMTPQAFVDKYNINDKLHNVYILSQVTKEGVWTPTRRKNHK